MKAMEKSARPNAWRRGRAIRVPLAETDASIADLAGLLGVCAAALAAPLALLYGSAWLWGRMKGWW